MRAKGLRRTRPAFGVALVMLLGTIAAALAVVAGGRAGSGPGAVSEFRFFAQPTVLSEGSEGIAWGRFKAASGTGSATHVVISITLPSGFNVVTAHTSSGCTDSDGNRTFTCNVGTVNAGDTVKRFVAFTAPGFLPPPALPAANVYPGFSGSATSDNGAQGPGGGSADEFPGNSVSITVVAAGDANRDGGCTGRPKTDDVPLSVTNLASTEIQAGTRLSSLGLTCTWAFVGENDPSTPSLSEISFFGFPETEPNAPVTWVVTVYKSPVSFKNLKVFFKSDYTGGSFVGAGVLGECKGPDNTLRVDPPQDACLKLLEKLGGGARATILAKGTGEDPGAGMG